MTCVLPRNQIYGYPGESIESTRKSLQLEGIPCAFDARHERRIQEKYAQLGAACAAAIAGEADEAALAAQVLRFFRAVTLPFPEFLEGYYQAVLEAFQARGYLTFKPRAEPMLSRASAAFCVVYSDAGGRQLFTRHFETQRQMMENTAQGACLLYIQSRVSAVGERVQILDLKIKAARKKYERRRKPGAL
jgi:hypothetical protein